MGVDRTSFGRQDNAGGGANPENPSSDVLIAEAGIWGAALTDAEVAILALGAPAYSVRPGSLVAYWPLIGSASPEIELIGRNEMTLQGLLGVGDHPRTFRYTAGSRRGSFTSSNPKSVSLSGNMAASAISTLANTVERGIAGVFGAGATDTFAIRAFKVLAGVIASGQIGSITPSALFALLDVQGIAAIGALVADTAQRIAIGGVQGTTASASMIAAVKLLLSGGNLAGLSGQLAEEIAVALIAVAKEAEIGEFAISDGWLRG